ncbi:MAG TPA: helix-turn-helix transcriptional regulator [Chloroflexota bacterium]
MPRFEAEWAIGAAASPEEAVAYADGAVAEEPARARQTLLTRREFEVATLVGRGLTSREVANALVISVKTADTHADRIRDKLGVRSRVEIAA